MCTFISFYLLKSRNTIRKVYGWIKYVYRVEKPQKDASPIKREYSVGKQIVPLDIIFIVIPNLINYTLALDQ